MGRKASGISQQSALQGPGLSRPLLAGAASKGHSVCRNSLQADAGVQAAGPAARFGQPRTPNPSWRRMQQPRPRASAVFICSQRCAWELLQHSWHQCSLLKYLELQRRRHGEEAATAQLRCCLLLHTAHKVEPINGSSCRHVGGRRATP